MIHNENPFRADPADRDPIRRFRGRIASGVTIVTAGVGEERTGLTVSSLLVIEGEPPSIEIVVGPATDLWSVMARSRRFVAHICDFEHHQLANVFAGLSPSPGGLFVGAGWEDSDWGPVLVELPDRVYCALEALDEVGFSGVARGQVQRVEVTDLNDPLVHFRGGYRRLGE
jgi:flavin reductase (DIM6/NTAB) family NADH-FMN oxidoreductase RutF